MKPRFWVRQNGELIAIKDLDDKHLGNCIALTFRRISGIDRELPQITNRIWLNQITWQRRKLKETREVLLQEHFKRLYCEKHEDCKSNVFLAAACKEATPVKRRAA